MQAQKDFRWISSSKRVLLMFPLIHFSHYDILFPFEHQEKRPPNVWLAASNNPPPSTKIRVNLIRRPQTRQSSSLGVSNGNHLYRAVSQSFAKPYYRGQQAALMRSVKPGRIACRSKVGAQACFTVHVSTTKGPLKVLADMASSTDSLALKPIQSSVLYAKTQRPLMLNSVPGNPYKHLWSSYAESP